MRRPLAGRIGKLCLSLACLQGSAAFAVPAYLQGNTITTYASAASTDECSKLTMSLEVQTHTVPLDALNKTLKGFVCKLGG